MYVVMFLSKYVTTFFEEVSCIFSSNDCEKGSMICVLGSVRGPKRLCSRIRGVCVGLCKLSRTIIWAQNSVEDNRLKRKLR